jgi:hypothetical protein
MSGVALGRSAFHGLPDLKREKVKLPQRGGYVLIREMCAEEILEFSSRVKADQKGAGLWLICRSLVDDAGERLFDDASTHLLAQSLNRDEFVLIQDKVMSINGLGGDVEKK